jgi:hypothetical protein
MNIKPYLTIFILISLLFVLIMPKHLSFSCVFPFILDLLGLLDPDPDPGCHRMGIRNTAMIFKKVHNIAS